jgi:hypothetical protein
MTTVACHRPPFRVGVVGFELAILRGATQAFRIGVQDRAV